MSRAYRFSSAWIAMSMVVERKVGAAVENALSDEQLCEKGLDKLIVTMKDELHGTLGELERHAKAQFQEIFDKVNNNEELDERTMVLAQQIWNAGDETIDGVITAWFGIPTDTEAMRTAFYEKLVLAFEEFALEVTAGAATHYRPESYHEQELREFEQHKQARAAADEAVKHLPPR